LTLNHGHIKADDLERYSMSALPDESAVRVERHLLVCETCRQRLLEAEEYMTAMKGAIHEFPASERAVIREFPAPERAAIRKFPAPERAAKRWQWSFPRLIPAFAALAFITIAAVTLPLMYRGAPAPVEVTLQTMRGPANQATAPAHRPLLLKLDLTGLAPSPSYRVEMVDRSGYRVWRGGFPSLGATGSVPVPAQKGGAYFVRVTLPSGETLREYSLQLQGTD
jgi:hypothetical protein